MTKIKSFELILGNECNNNCRFCSNKKLNFKSPSFSEIKNILLKNKSMNTLYLVGGEPTLRKDLIHIIIFARKIGIKNINIQTNARMLSVESYLDRLISLKVNIGISIHAHKADIHDLITGSNQSFFQVLSAIKILNKRKYPFTTNTVICSFNQNYIKEIVIFLKEINSSSILLTLMSPIGILNEELGKLLPDINILKNKTKEISDESVKFLDFPLCITNKDHISFESEKKVYIGKQTLLCIKNKTNNEKTKYSFCNTCKLSSQCQGLWTSYKISEQEFYNIIK